MNITFNFKSKALCRDYLKVIYDNLEYTLIEFATKFKDGDFSLDIKLKECIIVYRGNKMTYEELCNRDSHFSEGLLFSERYSKEIYPLEHFLIIGNKDYYKAAKFVNKTERCLQTARYYLMNSYDLLKTDFDVNWETGYGSQFLLRTVDFTTSVVWYNSCFDYILQVIYFAFGLYKKIPGFNDQMSHEKLLKECSYSSLSGIYGNYKSVQNFRELWEIVNKCYNSLTEVNSWSNYIKHKGGIAFKGLYPPDPFVIKVTDVEGKTISETSDFESIELEMDEGYDILKKTHRAIYDCINELVDYIDFKSAMPQKDPNNENLPIPDVNSYVKVILP